MPSFPLRRVGQVPEIEFQSFPHESVKVKHERAGISAKIKWFINRSIVYCPCAPNNKSDHESEEDNGSNKSHQSFVQVHQDSYAAIDCFRKLLLIPWRSRLKVKEANDPRDCLHRLDDGCPSTKSQNELLPPRELSRFREKHFF